MKEFYFIRHAKTKYNLENRYTGSIDIPIYKDQDVSLVSLDSLAQDMHIISSPMLRAVQTVELLQFRNKRKIQILNGLRERDFGFMNGKKKPSFTKKSFHKGETYYQFRKRVLQEFQNITKSYDKFIIVSHSGVYKVLYKYLQHLNPELEPRIDNLQLVKFNMDGTYAK